MDNASTRQKVEAVLAGKLSVEETQLIGGCLDEQDRRSAELQKRLRRQEQEFTTVFEMVGQISARAMDAENLLKYLLRTVMGQFMVPNLVVLRRLEIEDKLFRAVATQGVAVQDLGVEVDGQLSARGLALARPFDLAAPEQADLPEAERLRSLGLVTCVPLVQMPDRDRPAQLEGFLVLGPRLAGGPLGPFEKRLLGLLGQAVAITFHNEILYRRSIADDLTGVASRGYFDAHLNREISRIRRYGGRGLSLVMLDLDHFKLVNDTHGHLAGDAVLQKVAAVLREGVRTVDVIARYGGEEFAIILIEIERESALEVAERLRRMIEAAAVEFNGQALKITGSLGVACFPDDADEKQKLVEAADSALYRAKGLGRNQVCVAPSRPSKGKGKPGDQRA